MARKCVCTNMVWFGFLQVVARSCAVSRRRAHLQQLRGDRLQQAHVLGAAHRQPVQTVVPDDLRYRAERLAELAQDVLAGLVHLDAHVHEAFGAPELGTH